MVSMFPHTFRVGGSIPIYALCLWSLCDLLFSGVSSLSLEICVVG